MPFDVLNRLTLRLVSDETGAREGPGVYADIEK